MIRVATFDDYEPQQLKELCKILYQAFGVGCEHVGNVPLTTGFHEPFDAHKLLEAAPKVMAFSDDKVLYLTARKLLARKLPNAGEAPTVGVAQYSGQRALITTAQVKNPSENAKAIARYAMQELGHTWGLHHCLDPRCAMYPQWTPSFPTGEASFCVFCREMSERTIRLAKS
jgi:archaemetzincin